MNKSYFKYILALLLFGSNGIVASYISLTSYEIVFWRTMIGSFLLILIIASLAYYCGPIIVMILSLLVFHYPLTKPKVIGFFTVLIGVFLVNNTNCWDYINY